METRRIYFFSGYLMPILLSPVFDIEWNASIAITFRERASADASSEDR